MKITNILSQISLVFISFIEIHGIPEHSPPENRIVGGNRVKYREEFPYQISLRYNGQHICGGTIYKQHYVITAAHCLDGQSASDLEVVAGDLSLKYPTKRTQKIDVFNITIHENYSATTIQNDVGVIHLKEDFEYSAFVRNVTIWNSSLTNGENTPTNCVVSGWGSTHQGGNVVADLRYVDVAVFPPYSCNYAEFYSPGMLCAGSRAESKDACTGDSGGPLVCQGHLYGIVSWGVGCGNPAFPGVYTNASHYAKWIEDNTNFGRRVVLWPLWSYLVTISVILAMQLILFN